MVRSDKLVGLQKWLAELMLDVFLNSSIVRLAGLAHLAGLR